MTKRKTVPAVIAGLLTVIIALAALNLSDIGKKTTWDIEIPMANANVTWQQTHHAGAWSDGR